MAEETSLEMRKSQHSMSETDGTMSVVPRIHQQSPRLFRMLGTTQSVHGSSLQDLYYGDVVAPRNITAAETDEVDPLLAFSSLRDVIDDDEAPEERPQAITESDVANRTRLELLARQYVSKQLSPEEEARLVIVTERVRRLIPRVTIEDFEELERIAENVQRIGLEDSQRRQLLGIK